MKRLKYILLMTLLALTAMVTAQESYVIDSVCVGADRNYRVEGIKGSTYEWFITNVAGDTIVESPGILFNEENTSGDSIYGSDLQVLWDTPDTFLITSLQYSIHGCDTIEQGYVIVYDPPFAYAGAPKILCEIDTVKLDDAYAQYYSRLEWTTLGDGTFEYDSVINSRYIPGTNDSISAGVTLIITAHGLAENATCTPDIDTIDVIFSTPLLTLSWQNLRCYNDSSGWIKANVSKGSGPYTYLWSGPNGFTADSDSIFNLIAGNYVLMVTDIYGCSVSSSAILTQPEELLATIDDFGNVDCFGGNEGFASVLVSGGTKEYTYEWNTFPAQDSAIATRLFAGDYTVIITDKNGCEVTKTVTITEPPQLLLSADSVDAICLGGLGSVDLTVSGGTPFANLPHYLYEWSDASGVIGTTEDITDLPGDVLYTVVVTDSIGCTDTLSILVNEEKDIQLSLENIDSILCYGGSNGAIDITVTDGKEPYKYLWDSGDTTQDLQNIPAGSYHVVVSDDNGCKQEMSFELLSPDELIADISAINEICENDNLLLDGNPSGGTGNYTQHQWTGSGASYLNDANIVDPEFSGAPAGIYSLIYSVTDENVCTSSDTLNITVRPVTYSNVFDSICASDLPYIWNDSTYFAAGIYQNVSTSIFGCDSIITFNLFIYDEIIITAAPVNEGTFGDADGSIDLTISGGTAPYTFNWNNGETTEDITGLTAGDYNIIVTDAKGCTETFTINITSDPADFTMDCPPMIIVECNQDLINDLEYLSFAQFVNAGGSAISACGINESTFAFEGQQEVAGPYCLNVLRTYSISDSCGTKLYCDQLIVVNDIEAPQMDCPPGIVLTGAKPAPFDTYASFFSAGGVATDNCEIDEATFRQLGSDVSDGNSNPEIITRTYEIADFCGNITTCTRIISLLENSGIYINCTPDITVSCFGEIPEYYNSFKDFEEGGRTAGSHPDVPIDTSTFQWLGDVSDGNSCPEIITRTYSIKNTAGEEATCEQLIIIRDVIKPVLELETKRFDCPDDENIPGIYNTRAQFESVDGNFASDDCELDWSTLRLASQNKDGSCPETIVRWYEIKDMCGNTTQAREVIIIDDKIRPYAGRDLRDLYASCEKPAPYRTPEEFAATSGSYIIENCGNWTIHHIGDSLLAGGDCPATIIRTYQFADVCGNISMKYYQNIFISDTIPPEFITCPDDITFDAGIDELGNLTGLAYSLTETPMLLSDTTALGISVFDECEIVEITYHDTVVGGCPAIVTRTFTVYDKCGNSSSCQQQIELTQGILIAESHVNVGTSSLPIGSIDITVSGGDEPYTFEWSGPDGYSSDDEDISNLFAGDYFVTVKDINECMATLTVTITSIPVVTSIDCPLDFEVTCIDDILLNPPYQYYKEYAAAGGVAESNCGLDTTTFTILSQDTLSGSFCLTVKRTYYIEDSCGNALTCEQFIFVNDTEPPVINCPADSSAVCLSDLGSNITILEGFIAAGGSVSDNCALDSSSFILLSENLIQTLNTRELRRSFSIKDLCGNESTCEQTIILTDTIPPDPACTDITVYIDSEGRYRLSDDDIETITAGSTDNCTRPEDLIIDIDTAGFSCADIESGVSLTVVVTDQAGNSSECVTNITVLDTIPPEALCQDITLYLDENGQTTVNLYQFNNGSYDNCQIDTIFSMPDSFDCTDVGDNSVNLVVIDASGNSAECEANVQVLDTIPPEITCNSDIDIQLEPNAQYVLTTEFLLDQVSDLCGVDTVYLDDYLLDCDNIGTTYITVTAVDVNGNSAECIAELTVYGNVAPNVVNDSGITVMNVPIEIDVLINDYDTKTNLDISKQKIVAHPANGTISRDTINGVLTYTPNLDFVGVDELSYEICDDGIPCVPMCGTAQVYITVLEPNNPPVAEDDFFTASCLNLNGNLLSNDSDPDLNAININTTLIKQPVIGEVIIYEDGTFEYIKDPYYVGIDTFVYQVCDDGLPSMCDTATVYIEYIADHDNDCIPDIDDIDDDNDGILDVVEGNIGNTWIDSDLDGIPDHLDIDADNDGIVDNVEGQEEGYYIPPTGFDSNNNGWDDAYDPENGGYEFIPADTDDDSTPDYLDLDSENDHVYDFIEGHDINADGVPDVTRIFVDSDNDGLDDIYDTVFGWNDPNDPYNALGSNSPLQDFDGDGIRDWRDINDEDDEFFTVEEDTNEDGDYSNDDLDLDGYPEYLDKTLDCELFIPEGFSPNGDGVHDFFQILCIQLYPNARLMIFNRNGDKLFDKEHYGNLEFWGSNEEAWWWGNSENAWTIGQTGGLAAGNYVYVVELGNGRVEKGTVMINY